jgi:hypothetical protein
MNKSKIFINLSSGIEALPKYGISLDDVSFIRLQSSHCEAHKWEEILSELDNNFLMHLALGYECIVYDFGSHTNNSKALYIGMEWVKYFLSRRWFHKDYKPIVKNKDISNYFEAEYEKIPRRIKRKIDYFSNFLFTDELRITPISTVTINDNKKEYYRDVIKDLIKLSD